MATEDVSKSNRATVRAGYGMSVFTGSWPHTGGTALGSVQRVQYDPGLRYSPGLREEERGEVFEVLYMGGQPLVQLRIVTNDADALAKAFPNTATVTGSTVVRWHAGTVSAGGRMSSVALSPLLIETDDADHYSLVLYKAIPLVVQRQDVRFSAREPQTVTVTFLGLRTSGDKIAEWGPLAKLTAP